MYVEPNQTEFEPQKPQIKPRVINFVECIDLDIAKELKLDVEKFKQLERQKFRSETFVTRFAHKHIPLPFKPGPKQVKFEENKDSSDSSLSSSSSENDMAYGYKPSYKTSKDIAKSLKFVPDLDRKQGSSPKAPMLAALKYK